jgi:hypothetical protein
MIIREFLKVDALLPKKYTVQNPVRGSPVPFVVHTLSPAHICANSNYRWLALNKAFKSSASKTVVVVVVAFVLTVTIRTCLWLFCRSRSGLKLARRWPCRICMRKKGQNTLGSGKRRAVQIARSLFSASLGSGSRNFSCSDSPLEPASNARLVPSTWCDFISFQRHARPPPLPRFGMTAVAESCWCCCTGQPVPTGRDVRAAGSSEA